tara:strand:- start:723 stop:998 length:276 start_codon:yes stop_codon:yes gene_type:complete
MVTAIILISTSRTQINSVAETLASLEPVSEVYSVSGNYDLVAIVRVADNDKFATFVTDQMAQIDGITSTHSMLAFNAFSRHDLDSMFSIGM